MKRKIAVGPGASSLILIAVVLALSVLTVLTMISARSDEAMATRSAETRQEVYALFAAGERSMAKLDEIVAGALTENTGDREACLAAVKENLPEGMTMKEDQVFWTEKIGNRALECAVRVTEPGSEQRLVWTLHRLGAGEIWEEDPFDDWGDWDEEEEDGDAEEDFGEDDLSEEDEENAETPEEETENPEEGETK